MARNRHRKLANCWAVLTAIVAVLLMLSAVYEINWGSGPPDSKGSWYVAGKERSLESFDREMVKQIVELG